MKTWVKVLLGIVAAVTLIIGIAIYATSGITDTTDRFFAATRAGDMASAYALTSKSLQRDNSSEKTAEFIKGYGLDKVVKTSWSSRSIKNSVGTLEGTVTTSDDAVVPLTVRLVKEGGEWRINAIEAEWAGMASRSGHPVSDLPSLAIQISATRLATSRFIDSLEEPDFSSFLGHWVNSMTLSKLESSFGKAREAKNDLAPLRDAQPTIEDAKVLNSRGVLEIKGHYDIAPGRYIFTYKLIPDGKDWKIASFEFQLPDSPER